MIRGAGFCLLPRLLERAPWKVSGALVEIQVADAGSPHAWLGRTKIPVAK